MHHEIQKYYQSIGKTHASVLCSILDMYQLWENVERESITAAFLAL